MIKKWCLLATFLSLSQSCAPSHPSYEPKFSWHYDRDLLPNSLFLRIENTNANALCIPSQDTRAAANIRFKQHGRDVGVIYAESIALLEWKGVNLIGGMIVIPPKRHAEIQYDLRGWLLAKGATTLTAQYPTVDCREFFSKGTPEFRRWTTAFEFESAADASLPTQQ